ASLIGERDVAPRQRRERRGIDDAVEDSAHLEEADQPTRLVRADARAARLEPRARAELTGDPDLVLADQGRIDPALERERGPAGQVRAVRELDVGAEGRELRRSADDRGGARLLLPRLRTAEVPDAQQAIAHALPRPVRGDGDRVAGRVARAIGVEA